MRSTDEQHQLVDNSRLPCPPWRPARLHPPPRPDSILHSSPIAIAAAGE